MTANICRALKVPLISGIEVPDVASLHDKHNDPVDARDDGIEGEWGAHAVVLAPYCVATLVVFAVRDMEGVVDPDNHHEEI